MTPPDPWAIMLRTHLPELFFGPVFVFLGVCACSVAAIRRRREFRVLLWFGVFIGMYGVFILARAVVTFGLAPSSPWPHRIASFIGYFLVVPGTLFWVELSVGKLRLFLAWLTAIGVAVGLFSVIWYSLTGHSYGLHNLIAVLLLLATGIVVVIPSLSRKYLIVQSPVLRIVLPVIALAAMFANLLFVAHREPPRYLEPAAFALWTLALGYVAVQRTFENERRLFAIEDELETARQIQFSILPANVPPVSNLRIAAAYHPMTAVAGDFYQFIQVDDHRLGVLVADVSGHGVPAALIASMIKVAMKSVSDCADHPSQVLCSLNQILSPELRGQFVSLAYLWIDSKNNSARYAGAGHPPLLFWRATDGSLVSLTSNGTLLGVPFDTDYPELELSFSTGDRFLLYTDGVSEAENQAGEPFGDGKFLQVVRDNQSLSAAELLQQVLTHLRSWQPTSTPQQDDLTLIVIDVL